MTSYKPAAKLARPSYQQLEALCTELNAENKSLKSENGSLTQQVAELSEQLLRQREEHEHEQRQQTAAAQDLFEALQDFCQQHQPHAPPQNVLTTPRLGVESRASTSESTSWAELENKVYAMSARVGQNKHSSPQKFSLGSLETSCRSPARRQSLSSFRRSRLSLGAGRRDPVGSFGEVVAQIARDRAQRQQKQNGLGNQENAPANEPSLTPPTISHTDRASSLTNSFRRCSFGRSPCSSLNQESTATPAVPGMVCMHTNMLANLSGDKTGQSVSPCGDSVSNNSVQASLLRPVDRDPVLDVAPTAASQEDSFNFAQQVLSDMGNQLSPSEHPAGLVTLLAGVVQKAKSKAVKRIAAKVRDGSAEYEHSESASLCAV